MGIYLDLDDVTSGNPLAQEELAALRSRVKELEGLLRRAYLESMDHTLDSEELDKKIEAVIPDLDSVREEGK